MRSKGLVATVKTESHVEVQPTFPDQEGSAEIKIGIRDRTPTSLCPLSLSQFAIPSWLNAVDVVKRVTLVVVLSASPQEFTIA